MPMTARGHRPEGPPPRSLASPLFFFPFVPISRQRNRKRGRADNSPRQRAIVSAAERRLPFQIAPQNSWWGVTRLQGVFRTFPRCPLQTSTGFNSLPPRRIITPVKIFAFQISFLYCAGRAPCRSIQSAGSSLRLVRCRPRPDANDRVCPPNVSVYQYAGFVGGTLSEKESRAL
ncbi:hypothetical protein SCHPADRAFT_498731 [Schizopora paradoxa]|uniref:Uncharacterized protein n=1 Tax=Schizopora paradoxa TaxID=27342 RepID=A0A0H2RN23_9AGAM|nr:hypothetical protein SCHPADRAFT_498731 [Schizopora paradoxa]